MNVEEARQIAKDKIEQLAAELERGQSDTLKAYLAAMSRMPRYSWNNLLLIAAQIRTAEKPLAPIEKGLAAPGLLAYVIVSKYGDHLPLHRRERILERHGIQIARSTLCDWAAQCAEVRRPLNDLMVQTHPAVQGHPHR
jgi:hypothetical protein